MAWSLTEETLLVRTRVAAILAQMTFVPAPVAVVVLTLRRDHNFDLGIGVLTTSGGMETCVAPLAPQRFELWRSDLPGTSHEKSVRSSSARFLLLWTVCCPMVIATTEVALPAIIVVVIVAAIVVIAAIVIAAVVAISVSFSIAIGFLQ
jgi:hypothetical protein